MFNPPFGAAPTDSYAAIYEHARARRASAAEVTVTADPAGGVSGGAGLIERDDMTARKHAREAVALFISSYATIVMSWNSSGGAHVDENFAVPSLTVRAPVALRLVRNGALHRLLLDRPRQELAPGRHRDRGGGRSGRHPRRRRVPRLGTVDLETTARFRDFRVR